MKTSGVFKQRVVSKVLVDEKGSEEKDNGEYGQPASQEAAVISPPLEVLLSHKSAKVLCSSRKHLAS